MSADASGAPRLIRAIAPRPGGAGMTASAAAQDHVAALSQLYVQQAPAMQLVENSTQQLRNGATLVKLDQMVDGVIVNQGELRVLMHTDGALAAVSGTLLAATVKPSFVSTPSQALDRALDKQFGATRPQLAITEAGTSGSWQKLDVAPTTDLVIENARARRELARIGDKLTEVWAVEVEGTAVADPAGDPDITAFSSHRYLVKDLGGAILRDDDLVQSDAFVYRVYADNTGIRRPFDSALASFAPHPTGIPDGSAPGLVPANLVVMEGFNGNLDPWLATNATTTLGNNAEAFADMDGTNNSSPSDVRPEVRAGRVLNYTYDHTLGPLANATQSKAAAVNAFYLVNWMHDWWYDSGFTEATANAQADNFGRGGVAGDPLLVLAQAGANIGNRNNANMATPADGARPRMRMYLWTAGTATSVTGPAGVLATTEPFAAGPRNFDLTGDLVAAVDPTAPTDDACQPPTNVAGKIALVTFSGACGSLATVNSVRAAGAVGIILEDPASDNPRAFAGSAAANIPGLAIGRTAGESLKAALGSGPVTVTLHSAVAGPERDGDLDNTVVAHEWGHYLHHRLTSCGGQQCGGMSEGWGDFNALMMMLREGENRDGVYAIGPYALADGVTADVPYFGIRRYPYSIDRTKNDLSFRHVSDGVALPTDVPGFPVGPNSEVHNAGEIWATMMWEVVNVLADEHGVAVARRRMSDYVVGGLLLAPPEATFTETRDAMLAAASALDTDDMILMAAAFAGRGMGSCAVSPPVDSPTNAGVVESGTLAAKLAMGGVSLTDDGISCDHDGYLDPGESGTLHVTLANNGILAADNVTLTATTSATGVRLGAPLKFNLVQPFTSSNLAIPVTVLQSAPRNALVTINLHVAGENTCDRNGVDIALTIRTGADDAPNTSATDNAETLITAWTAAGGGAADLWGKAREAGGNQSFFAKNAGFPSDTQFASPSLLVDATAPLVISFNHRYNLEGAPGAFFDGGVLELSQDGGATWSDVTTFGVNPGYTGALFVGSGNPIQGRNAYSGVSPGFPARQAVSLNFGTAFAGQSLQFRFRLGTDANTAFSGWDIDDVQVSGITNTPFPTVVSEPSTCTARKAPGENIGVLATLESPQVSLDGFDAAVCIKNDIE
ncbi:MAG TPA: M36 family metallopeptidase [Kofleriaceae bacterium]|nr:M36 family metallopeptidase [Kofleriaceae bacterium]